MDNDSGLSSDAEDNNPPKLNRKRKATSDSDGKSACSQKPKLIKTDNRELSSNSDDEPEPENGKEVCKVDKDAKSNSSVAWKLKPEQYQMTLFEMEKCHVSLVDVVNSRSKSLPVNSTQHIPEEANRLHKATFHTKSDSSKSIIQTSDSDSDSGSGSLKNSSKTTSLRKNKNLNEMSKKDAELLSDSDEEFAVSKKDVSKNLKFNILTDSEEETEANQSGKHLKSIDESNVEYTESKTTNTAAKFQSQRRHKKFIAADDDKNSKTCKPKASQSDSDDKLLQEKTVSASQTSSRVKSRMKHDKPNSDSEDKSNEEQLKKESPLSKAQMNQGSSDSSSEDESDKEFKSRSKIHSDADNDSDSDEPLKTKSPISKSQTSFKRSLSRPKVADSDSEDRSDKELVRKHSLKSHQSDSDDEQLKKKSPISRSRRTSIKITPSKREVLDSSSEDDNKELSKKPKSKFQGSDVDEPIKKPTVIRSPRTSLKKRSSKHTDSDSEYATESDSDVVIEHKPPKKVQSDSVNESLVNKKTFSTKSLISKLKKYSSETNSDSENENTKASGSNTKVTNNSSSEHPAKRHHGRCSESSGDSEIEGKDFSGAAKPQQSNSERDCTPNKQVLSSDKIKSQTSKKTDSLLVRNAASDSDDEPLSSMKRNRIEESSGDEASSDSTYSIKRTKSASSKSASKKTKNLSRSEVNKPQTQNSDGSEDESSLSKSNDDALADEDGAERKRAGCSDGSSESGSGDIQTISAGKRRKAAEETPTKKTTGQTSFSERKIAKLKRFIAASGLRVVHVKVLRDCKTTKAQINKLMEILEDAGMKGPPTWKKCERLKHKRGKMQEAEALDQSNVLATPKDNMDNDSGLSSDAEDNNPPKLNRKRKATSDSDGKSACSQKPKLIKTDSRELSSNSDDESKPENGKEVGKVDKDAKSNSSLARKLKPEQYQMTLFEMEKCHVSLVDVVNSQSKSLPVNSTQHIPEVANRLHKATFHTKSDSSKSIIQTSDSDSDSGSGLLKNLSKNMSLRKNKNLNEMSKKDAELLSDSDEEFAVSKKDVSKNLKFNILTDSEEETEANQSGKHLKSVDASNVEYTESKTTNTAAKFQSQRRHKKFIAADDDKNSKTCKPNASQSDSDDKPLQEKTVSASQTSSRVKSRMKHDKPNSDSEDKSNEEQLKKESPLSKAQMNQGSSDSSSEDESDKEFKSRSKIQSDADNDSDSDEPLKTKSPISKSRTSFKRSLSRPKVADSDSEDRSDKELVRKHSLKSHQSDSDDEQLKKKSPISRSRRTSIKITLSKREVLDSSSEDDNKELSKKPKSKFQGSDVDEPLKKPPVIRSPRPSLKKRSSKHTDSDSEYATESDSDVVIEHKPKKKVQSDSVNESLVNKKAFSTKSVISKLKKYSSETNSDSENENTKASGSNTKVTNNSSSEHPAKRHHGRCSESSGDSEIEGKDFSGAAKPQQSNSERDCTPNKQVLSSDKIKSQTSKKTDSLLVRNAASDSDDEPLSSMKRNRIEESSGDEASSDSTYSIKRTKSASSKSASKKTKNLSRSEVNKPQTQNSDSSEDEISLSKLKLENRKLKSNDDAMADEDGAERKRAGCSDGSSESGSGDIQTISAGKRRKAAKEAPTKKTTGQTSAIERKIAKLKRFIAASGLRVVYVKVLRDCKTMKAQVNKLLEILEDAGMKGPPTWKKCERLKHKREKRQEAEALDQSNVLATPKGRSRRTRYNAPSTQVPRNLLGAKPHTDTVPSKKIFSRLKGIVDSDDSSN